MRLSCRLFRLHREVECAERPALGTTRSLSQGVKQGALAQDVTERGASTLRCKGSDELLPVGLSFKTA